MQGVFARHVCKACMQVKYCDATCQKNHWATHKKPCKQRVAELMSLVFHMLWEEALFQDHGGEDCPICYLPMPVRLLSCISLPPGTLSSLPINDFANEYKEVASQAMEVYYPCCGKNICKGCVHSFICLVTLGSVPFANRTDLNRIKR